MIGYDIDGTLCVPGPKRNKPFFKQNGPERKAHEEKTRIHMLNAEVMRIPSEPFILITGRKEKWRSETEEWIRKQGWKPEGLYMLQEGRTRANMIKLKVKVCKELNVSVYYEDDLKIAKAMAREGINVVRVWNGQEG